MRLLDLDDFDGRMAGVVLSMDDDAPQGLLSPAKKNPEKSEGMVLADGFAIAPEK